MIAAKGGASEPPNMRLPGKAGGTVAVRRTLACTICRIADPTQVPRPRQLRDVSTVMRLQPAHQRMINRRHDGCASSLARQSLKQPLPMEPQIHAPATWKGGHERVVKPDACYRVRRSAGSVHSGGSISGRWRSAVRLYR